MYNQVYMKKFKLYYLKKKRIKDLVAAWKYEDQSRKQKEKKKKERKKQTKNMKQTRQATDEKSNNSDKRSGIDSNEFNFNHLICRFFFF